MFPNSRVINRLKNPFLRVALYTTEGTERKKLEKAFPRCYSKKIEKLRIPLSLIQSEALRESGGPRDEKERNWLLAAGWVSALDKFEVPIAFQWSDQKGWKIETVPPEIRAQLDGQILLPNMKIDYLGEKFILATFENDAYAQPGQPIEWINDPSVFLVHPRFIDLNS
jgi:hypothetical protein